VVDLDTGCKTRVHGLPAGEDGFSLGTIPACNRQTDGRTEMLSIAACCENGL